MRIASICRTGALALSFAVFGAANAFAASCVGNCGTSGPDGVVTASPAGGSYSWISTYNGAVGAGQLSGVGGVSGSSYETDVFSANAGAQLDYYFNYITSDGSGYADYAWVQLQDAAGGAVAMLLTARTQPSGDIIPGFDLPAIDATLSPPSVPIIGGGPAWSPLGTWSGNCWSEGCGYTGWVLSNYVIETTGLYKLVFGVTDWDDDWYSSGLAFSGITIDGVPVGEIPLPAALPLFLAGVAFLGFGRRRAARRA